MSRVAPFPEIVRGASVATRRCFRIYAYGALLLIVAGIVSRALGYGFFVMMGFPALEGQIGAQLILGIIGVTFSLVGALSQVLHQAFTLVLAVDRTQEVVGTMKKSLRYVIPLIGGGIWVFVRSYSWLMLVSIPFFALARNAPLMALIGGVFFLLGFAGTCCYMPRYVFTNIIQIREGKGIRDSAAAGFERTKGYWGKIVGNHLLFMACLLLCGIGIFTLVITPVAIGFWLHRAGSDLAAFVVATPLFVAAIVVAFVLMFSAALFTQSFVVELYETISKHPILKKARIAKKVRPPARSRRTPRA